MKNVQVTKIERKQIGDMVGLEMTATVDGEEKTHYVRGAFDYPEAWSDALHHLAAWLDEQRKGAE